MPTDFKTCAYCGTTFTRKWGHNDYMWQRKEYCDNKCAVDARNKRDKDARSIRRQTMQDHGSRLDTFITADARTITNMTRGSK